jgi:transposase InsO family protein
MLRLAIGPQADPDEEPSDQANIFGSGAALFDVGGGPSWLTLIGNTKDSLWSVDLFRCESIVLKSYWVMVVMDLFTRRIVGFGVAPTDVDGVAVCRMFNHAISGQPLPKHLSTDNDPLFRFHRWRTRA